MLTRIGLAAAALTILAALPLGLTGSAHADTPTCAGMTATIVGTDGNDNLVGTSGADIVYLGNGNDRFVGGNGDDVICGGAGDDALYGGEGNDSLYGEDGNDHLVGGADNDTVVTGSGANSVTEGPGDDSLQGGPGTDSLDYQWSSQHSDPGTGVTIDTAAGTATGYGTDTLHGFDYFSLTNNADTFRGRDVIERVYAYGGDDTIWTAGGNDRVVIGIGTKVVNTGTGDDIVLGNGTRSTRISLNAGDDRASLKYADVISGGDGNDTMKTLRPRSRLVGGPGSDTVVGSGNRARHIGVDIDLIQQRARVLNTLSEVWYLSSIENAAGTPFDDMLYGDSGPNILRGLDGDDYIDGRGGNDTIVGGEGDDTIVR